MNYFAKSHDSLDTLIDEFFQCIIKEICLNENNIVSILLLGSLSRGEGTWNIVNNKLAIESDIEFFIVHNPSLKTKKLIVEKIDNIKDRILKKNDIVILANTFHIDYSFINIKNLKSMEKKLLIYDAKKTGRIIYGKDIRHLLPEVNINNINLYDIKDILTHRAFSILDYKSKFLLTDLTTYKYVLAKNSLYLMNVYLVSKGVLSSGFVNSFNNYKHLCDNEKYIEYMNECLKIKLGLDNHIDYDIDTMENIFINILEDYKNIIKIKGCNLISNIKSIIKRRLGIIKRILISKEFPQSKYLERLILLLQTGSSLEKKDYITNYILNGYPNISEVKHL